MKSRHLILLALALSLSARAATDIVPKPGDAGNLGADTNRFPIVWGQAANFSGSITGANFSGAFAGDLTGNADTAGAVRTVPPWTMIVIPDTQYLSQMTNGGAEALTAISNFIVLNKNALNIKLVMGEGDLVNDASLASEWGAMSNFYGGIQQSAELPVVPTQGNHDLNSLGSRNNTIYHSYFPTTSFTVGDWTFKDAGAAENSYLLQTNNGVPWVFIALEWAPRTNSLDWVTNVLTTYSNHNAAIVTHMFVSEDRDLERADSVWNQTTGYSDANNATNMWERWFKFHSNLRMILNGHAYTAPSLANVTRYGVYGNKVAMMCFNHQNPTPNQTNLAFVRIVQFDEKNSRAQVRTYNPYTGRFYTNGASQFGLDFADSNFPDETQDDFRVRSENDAFLSLQAPRYQWTFRTSDTIKPWGTASELELRGGSHSSPYSNSVALRIGTNGNMQTRGDIVSPVMDQMLYFPLDEGFGNAAYDKVRGARAANPWALGSTNSWINGAIGGAFLATAQRGSGLDANVLSLTNDAATYGALQQISVSAWVKFGALGDAGQSMIVTKFNGGTDGSWALLLSSATEVTWTTINATDRDNFAVTVPDLSDHNWHHIVATFDGNETKKVYFDGVLVGTDSTHTGAAGALKATTHELMIGEYPADGSGVNYVFNGGIDEVRIFSRPITAAEVLTLFRLAKDTGHHAHASGTLYYSAGPESWPIRPYFPGAFYIGYSNGHSYQLSSTNGGGGVATSWTHTNLLGFDGNAATITTAAGSDSTSFPLFSDSATGNNAPRTDAEFQYDPTTDTLGVAGLRAATNALPGDIVIPAGKVSGTNISANLTVTGFSGVDHNYWRGGMLWVTNDGATDRSITFQTGTRMATNSFVLANVVWCTNRAVTIISHGVGFNTTNVAAAAFY